MTSRISIVTPVYNSAKVLPDCLSSVAQQDWPAYEHIVVDGASTDESSAVAARFPHVSEVVSEPDRGVYDAMNKGIALASGDVVGILNADDLYAHPRVLQLVARAFERGGAKACYGDLLYFKDVRGREVGREASVVRYWRSGAYRRGSFRWGWMPPHPTFFVRRRVYDELGGFDLTLGTAADYELMLRLLMKHDLPVAYVPEVLAMMRVGGVSNASLCARLRANRMDRQAWRVNSLRPLPWTLVSKPLRKVPQWFRRAPVPSVPVISDGC